MNTMLICMMGKVDLDIGFNQFVKLWKNSRGEALIKAMIDRYATFKK
jgi:hypothetical protein